MPLTGTWTADVTIDPNSSTSPLPAVGDPVTVTLGVGSFTLSGAVRRSNVAFGLMFARLVGGAGGLYQTIPAKAWENATFGMIVNDLLGQVGETLSTTVPGSILNISIPFWTIMAGPAFYALANLVLAARDITSTQVNWRVLTDGTIFIGVEQWPAAPITDFSPLSWSPQQLEASFFSIDPNITPGQTFEGGNVSNLEHLIDPDKVKSNVWWLNP